MSSHDYHISKQILDRFCVAGINYNKADVATRGSFAVSNEVSAHICDTAKAAGIRSVFVVSTCNRTEIYGFGDSAEKLVDILVDATNGSKQAFLQHGYLKNSMPAIEHLFHVAAGLDSQILGDYEILGQIKRAVDFSKTRNMIGPVMDRVLNFVLQASKKIKTDTKLSNGTVSVSFAAIELLQKIEGLASKKIVLVGTGKFGTNICRNLKTYLDYNNVSVCNRTDAAAEELATATGMQFIPYADRFDHIAVADIVIVCTNAPAHTILPEHISGNRHQLFLDLSVPANVHPDVKKIEQVRVIDVDEISTTILDKTLSVRRNEVPQAIEIISHYITEFTTWLKDYRYALHLKSWREKLCEINLEQFTPCEFAAQPDMVDESMRAKRAQKAVKQLAVNLKVKHDKGCQFINSINDFLQTY